MARSDFNLGNEALVDLVTPDGRLIDLTGLVEFSVKPLADFVESKPITNGGRTLRRTVYHGFEGSLKFDRQSNAADILHNILESNYFNGGRENYFTLQHTIRDPKSNAINQFQYEECVVMMDDAGTHKADEKVSQEIKFRAARRVQVA